MEFKKCNRCGCFFLSNDNVCCNCMPKDTFELGSLKTYIENTDKITSLETISYDTGISVKNLNRYLGREEFISLSQKINQQKIQL